MALKLEGISKSYGGKPVIEGLSLEIPRGGTHIVTGQSGIGKTTLLRLMLGLTKPDSGSISSGEPYTCSASFQEALLLEDFSSVANIKAVCPDLGEDLIIRELSSLLPSEELSKPVRELSGGMRKRVSVVRACLKDSDILVLDEPLTGLDTINKKNVVQYIATHRKERTLIISSHEDVFGDAFGQTVFLSLDHKPQI